MDSGVIRAVPRPYSSQVTVEEAMVKDEDGNTRMVKLVVHTVFHELGVSVFYYDVDDTSKLMNQFATAYKEAKSPLMVVKDMPPNGKIT